jgi:glycosyltransferase involved in cell wall biosynthesis
MIRLAHLVTHPVQYFAPLYRELSRQPGVELTVFFASRFGLEPSFDPGYGKAIQYDVPLLSGYAARFLPNRGAGAPTGKFANFDCPEFARVLRVEPFDAVWVHGWGYRAQWQAIWASWSRRIPFLVRSETTEMIRSKSRLRGLFRRFVVGAALRRAAGCLCIGRANRRFLEGMGVPDARLFPAHYSIEAERFVRAAPTSEERGRLRARFGAGDADFVIATCAKALPHKRLQDPVEAMRRLGPSARLWVLGDGPERGRLEALAATVSDRIHFHGFVNQQEMPRLLHACDAFVLPSEIEPWGLAVNEAMACGLPAVCSDRCGCAEDLVREGLTGYAYPTGDVDVLVNRLERLRSDREQTRRMGRNAQDLIVRDYDVKTTAGQVAAAVRAVVAGKRPEVRTELTPTSAV